MSYTDKLAAAGRFLRDNDHFLVVNHISPDGDATGSILAMGHMLKALGKTFVLANEGMTPERFMFLPMSERIQNLSSAPLEKKFDCCISLDCGDFGRIGKSAEHFSPQARLLNIDHHATNEEYGTENLVRTDACATAEILFDLVQEMQLPLDRELATCLYTGILTDTGGFRYSNTNAAVMNKAGRLLDAGAMPGDIAQRSLETISKPALQLLMEVLPTVTYDLDGKAASLSVTLEAFQRSQASPEDTEGLVNYARNIEGVEVGILFKQTEPDMVKVSLRSKSRLDVAAVAKELGGGGHVRASGCTVKGTLEQAQQAVMEKVREAWVNSEW